MLYKTPLKVIRYHCFLCSGRSYPEIKLCTSKLCKLYSWRMGKNPWLIPGDKERISTKAKTPLKAIREHCINCAHGSIKRVKYCDIDCVLFPWRFGKHPYRKKKTGKEIISQEV